jgi:aryl-alcohol dehydrogenase-like predicted oxidoreductase
VLPIPGAKRVKYLAENTAAADIRLTPDQVEHLSDVVPADAVAGDRYPPAMMAALGH